MSIASEVSSHVSTEELSSALAQSPLGPDFGRSGGEIQQYLARELALVWRDFTARLQAVPVISKLESGTLTRAEYMEFLLNLRQQVIDGGRWIAQVAASLSQPLFVVRSAMIRHAADEHRDYQMIENNYVALGGIREQIEGAPQNIGSEIFSAYMFQQASQPDPLNLFGAMFIIEGLGNVKAGPWAGKLRANLGLTEEHVSFLEYHGANDDDHYEKLRTILSAPFIDMPVARRIVRTAKVVGRLYALQLEEIGQF